MDKTLGFHKKDAWKFKQRHKSLITDTWRIPCNKLVPVVSVEWLKKWCKETKKKVWDEHEPYVEIESLLVAVEKEAGKK